MITKWLHFQDSHLYLYPTLSRMRETERTVFPELPENKLRVILNVTCSSLNIWPPLSWVTCYSPWTPLEWYDLWQISRSTQRYPLNYRDQRTVLWITRVCIPCSIRAGWVLRRRWIYRLSSRFKNNMGRILDEIIIKINIISGWAHKAHIEKRKSSSLSFNLGWLVST